MKAARAVGSRQLVLLLACLAVTAALTHACRCDDTQVQDSGGQKLPEEDQRAAAIDRVRFNLKTPDDYAKEAYLAIDVDNAKAELELLRREIDAEFAAGGAGPGSIPAASR